MTIAATLVALATLQTAVAAPSKDTVFFKKPALGGSGCPANSSDYAITPDGQTLSILFDEYLADPGNKTCNIAIPVHVPNGFQVSNIKADFRGFVEGRAELRRSYFFAGQRGPSLRSRLASGDGKDYLQSDRLQIMSNSWSKCGEDVNMRINSRIRTRGRNSFVSVDSLDISSGMVFHLQYRRCR